MEFRLPTTLLAVALYGAFGPAQATETAMHNDMDGDGRSELILYGPTVGWCPDLGTYCGFIGHWTYSVAKNAYEDIQSQWVGARCAWAPSGFDLGNSMSALTYSDSRYNNRRSVLLVVDATSGNDFSLFPYQDNLYLEPCRAAGSRYSVATGSGDFNGDGLADLLYRNTQDGSNKLQLSAATANPSFRTLPVVSLSWKVAGIGDFDGDGRSDILWRNMSTGQNSIWRSGDAATKQAVASVPSLDWIVATVGDFNGDHHSDIFWHNTRTGQNTMWPSANSSAKQVLFTVSDLAWKVAATGDFNGDGKWDVVWWHSATGSTVLWKSANRNTRETLPAIVAPDQIVIM